MVEVDTTGATGSNCTLLELKEGLVPGTAKSIDSSNCTLLELKG